MASMTLSVCGLLLVLSCFLSIGEQASVLQKRELSNDAGVRASFEWAEYRHGISPRIKHVKRAHPAEVCEDTHDSCRDRALMGDCQTNPDFMLKRCRKSCHLCTEAVCIDTHDSCRDRALLGDCEAHPGFMLKRCRKSCHVCIEAVCSDTHDLCPGWASVGQCQTNSSYMLENCKKSCSVCRVDECRDTDEECHSWSMTGECQANPNYMLEQCKPSCGVCTRIACEDKDDDCVGKAAQGECDSNPIRMRSYCQRSCHICTPDKTEIVLGRVRPGAPTTTHSCNHVRGVPEELRDPANMHPDGLDQFYQKYTEAYGIPIVSSAHVSDDALKRFCYVVRVLLAEHSGVRENVYKRSGRMGIVGIHETTTTIPEHSHLDPGYWDYRTRALGATVQAPVSTAGEENILCFRNDTGWLIHDISLHEFSHAAHIIGMNFAVPTWGRRLNRRYMDNIASGLWGTSYAAETVAEFFAVGVVAYYNSYRTLPTETCMDGNSGPIVTRKRLREFDPVLYGLIREIFPCDNAYINRCTTSREVEMRQEVRMDCENSPVPDTYVGDQSEPAYTPEHVASNCIGCSDHDASCPSWASSGECSANPGYMLKHCKVSCLVCTP